jgi:hypothetical protein
MHSFLYLAAGLAVGTVITALLLRLPIFWAAAVGLIGGLAIWYIVWGRNDLAAALRKDHR